MVKKIGVLGSGIVGQTLASGFLKHGFQVMVGTRDPSKLAEWKAKAGNQGSVGSFAETAAFGEMIALCVKGTAALEALNLAGAERLKDKTIVDSTNPIADAPPQNGVLKFFTSLDDSLMERLQKKFPEARFVKAFSCIGSAFMVNPQFKGGKPAMFICGNHEGAKKDVSDILDRFGFEVEDMGQVEAARAIEPLCMLWCIPGLLKNQWAHAFKLVR